MCAELRVRKFLHAMSGFGHSIWEHTVCTNYRPVSAAVPASILVPGWRGTKSVRVFQLAMIKEASW
jgi:hypothetical protein